MLMILQILSLLVNVIVMLVIVQFIISLLVMFNVVSMQNPAVSAIYSSFDMILAPLLNPIRKMMPDTGAIDLSPLVLIIGLQILMIVIGNLAVY